MHTDAQPVDARPTLRERRQRRTRSELVEATLTVIAEQGIGGATIDRIGGQAGVSRGTVYAYFPDGRDELLRAAYARLGTRVAEQTRASVAAAGEWRERLNAHARTLFALASDSGLGQFYNVSGPALVAGGPEQGIGSGASSAMIRETLEEAQREGDADPGADPGILAMLLVGALREAAVGVAAGTVDERRALAGFARLVAGLARTSA